MPCPHQVSVDTRSLSCIVELKVAKAQVPCAMAPAGLCTTMLLPFPTAPSKCPLSHDRMKLQRLLGMTLTQTLLKLGQYVEMFDV